VRVLAIFTVRSPLVVDTVLSRVPFPIRLTGIGALVRVGADVARPPQRRSGLARSCCNSFASTDRHSALLSASVSSSSADLSRAIA